MQALGLVLGIVSLVGMFIFLIPFLGWGNWFNIPLAVLGLVFSLIGVTNAKGDRTSGVLGIIFCVIAIIVGSLRLKIGCGII
jgi:hypothetical protein